MLLDVHTKNQNARKWIHQSSQHITKKLHSNMKFQTSVSIEPFIGSQQCIWTNPHADRLLKPNVCSVGHENKSTRMINHRRTFKQQGSHTSILKKRKSSNDLSIKQILDIRSTLFIIGSAKCMHSAVRLHVFLKYYFQNTIKGLLFVCSFVF